jgi:hypothetical protein
MGRMGDGTRAAYMNNAHAMHGTGPARLKHQQEGGEDGTEWRENEKKTAPV